MISKFKKIKSEPPHFPLVRGAVSSSPDKGRLGGKTALMSCTEIAVVSSPDKGRLGGKTALMSCTEIAVGSSPDKGRLGGVLALNNCGLFSL